MHEPSIRWMSEASDHDVSELEGQSFERSPAQRPSIQIGAESNYGVINQAHGIQLVLNVLANPATRQVWGGELPLPTPVSLDPPIGLLPDEVYGRKALLSELLGSLTDPPDAFVVLCGLGGCGKTTAALWLAREAWQRGIQTWWIRCDDPQFVESMLQIARELGAEQDALRSAYSDPAHAAALTWSLIRQCTARWLLIFDNADDPGVLAVGDEPVGTASAWVRPAQAGLVVVTSRVTDPNVWGTRALRRLVGELDSGDAVEMLTRLVPTAGNAESAGQLAARLSNLPLALEIAAHYLRSGISEYSTFDMYRARLDRQFSEMARHRVHGKGDSPRRAVLTTWETSLDGLASNGQPEARPITRLLSCLDLAPVPLDLFLQPAVSSNTTFGGSPLRVQEALRSLLSLQLIAPGPTYMRDGEDRKTIVMHPMVKEVNEALLHDEVNWQHEIWHTAFSSLTSLCRTLDVRKISHWPSWSTLFPHCLALLEQASVVGDPEERQKTLDVGNMFFLTLRNRNSLHLAQELLTRCLRCAATLHDDNSLVLTFRHNHAEVMLACGMLRDAELACRDVLARRIATLGRDDPDTLSTQHNLALVMTYLNELDEAEQLYRNVLSARLRILGPEDPKTLSTRHNLAQVLHGQGSLQAADAEFSAVLAVESKVLGVSNPHTLTTRHNRGCVWRDQGRMQEALEELRSVFLERQRILGDRNPRTLLTRREIASIEARVDDANQALSELRIIVDLERTVLGEAHPDTLFSRYELGTVAYRMGLLQEARDQFDRAHTGQVLVLGETHPASLLSRYGLSMASEQEKSSVSRRRDLSDITSKIELRAAPSSPYRVRLESDFA